MPEEKQILDPTLDVVFKLLFGRPSNKDILISLLTAVMQPNPERPIVNVTIKNPEIPDLDSKDILLDILVELEDGTQVDVEMQSSSHTGVRRRGLFYWARMFYTQLDKGERYSLLKPSIVIFFMNFCKFPNKRFHSVFQALEVHDHFQYSDVLELHCIELPKLRALLKNKEGPLKAESTDKLFWWARFLAAANDGERKEAAMGDPMIEKAYNELKRLSVEPEAKEMARQREMALINRRIESAATYEEGFRKGESEGFNRGKDEGETKGMARSVISVLRSRSLDVTKDELRKILSCDSPDTLEEWLKKALTVDSVRELFE